MVNGDTAALKSWMPVHAERVADSGVKVDIVRGGEGLAAIAGDWRDLYATAKPEQVFLSEAWLSLWHKHYAEPEGRDADSPLAIVTCRDAGRLVLVWPLTLVRRLGLRILKWAGEPVSQYGDVLIAPGHDAMALLEAAWQGIRSLRPDALVLRKTRAGCLASQFLLAKGAFVSEQELAPYIDLDGAVCPKTQAERYPSKDRKNRRRHRKRLAEHGELSFDWLAPSAEAGRLARDSVAMKRHWLRKCGRISKAFTDGRIEDFLGDALSGSVAGLDARVGVMRCGGKPAALLVGFLNQGYYAGFLTAYDEAFERHSPGSLLFEDAIRAAIGEKIGRIDLLAPADPYKHDWASAEVGVEDLCLPLTAGGRIYTRVIQSGVRHGLKAGIESLPPKLRRPLLAVATVLPALLYASSEP